MQPAQSPDESEPQQPRDGVAPVPMEPSLDGTAAQPAPADNAAPSDQPRQVADDDRRASPRRKKLLRVQIIEVQPNGESEPFPGWVTDRSLGGLRLEVERAIEAGSSLRVRSPYASANTPWVEVNVQSVQDLENCRYLGCSFVRTPTWEVLMQFG